jgi:acyl carrier protein
MAPCNVIGGILRPSHVAARQPKAVAFQQGRRKPQGVYSLPDHMIPSTYVLLEAMPLTPNGKVDRQGLPEPEKARPELQNPYAAPRTPVEEILAEIWADVIGVEQVGIHDNFFELGGDSLLATRIVSRILQHFRLEISLRSLFQLPTVAEIGTLITGH